MFMSRFEKMCKNEGTSSVVEINMEDFMEALMVKTLDFSFLIFK